MRLAPVGNDHLDGGIVHHVAEAISGVVRIERHGTARLQDAEHADDHVGRGADERPEERLGRHPDRADDARACRPSRRARRSEASRPHSRGRRDPASALPAFRTARGWSLLAGAGAAVSFHSSRTRRRSSSPSIASALTRLSGAASMASSRRCKCWLIRSTVAPSNRSVAYSSVP